MAGQLPGDFQDQHHFLEVVERLQQQAIDVRVRQHADLLFEVRRKPGDLHVFPHARPDRPDGSQHIGLPAGGFARDFRPPPDNRLRFPFQAVLGQPFPARGIRVRLDDPGARLHVFAVHPLDHVRIGQVQLLIGDADGQPELIQIRAHCAVADQHGPGQRFPQRTFHRFDPLSL